MKNILILRESDIQINPMHPICVYILILTR